jgi:hypothetical protein
MHPGYLKWRGAQTGPSSSHSPRAVVVDHRLYSPDGSRRMSPDIGAGSPTPEVTKSYGDRHSPASRPSADLFSSYLGTLPHDAIEVHRIPPSTTIPELEAMLQHCRDAQEKIEAALKRRHDAEKEVDVGSKRL